MFSAGGTTKSTKNNKVNAPTYPQVVKEPQTSYPKEIARNDYTINFVDLKNPTIPTYPEVPPIPIEKKIDYILPSAGTGTGIGDTINLYGIVDIRYGVVLQTNLPTSTVPEEVANAGTVNVRLYDSAGRTTDVNYIRVLNASSDFYAYPNAETIVFFKKYALFPVWM